jgi:hypothetical protein
MTTVAGSTWGTAAISTSPPPNRRRWLPLRPVPPVRAEPLPALLPDPVRIDGAGALRAEGADDAELTAGGAEAVTGAIPQVSQ